MDHPFSRYADVTDLDALLASIKEPPRKSIRVNTLKSSVDAFEMWAKRKGWELEDVEWCKEGFFIVPRSESSPLGKLPPAPLASEGHGGMTQAFAAGRDLLHQLGHTYIQEASSMLPVELLDPQPHETILDLCAAPGSKTTQMAAKMQNTGCIVANDAQLKRLWTLKQNLNRCGVLNCITTNLQGERFGRQMVEQFDRVLCDAPCSAQGIVRSDPGALKFSTPRRVEKMVRIQTGLLESAIHAAKVGGRIVYSTCTLTPEENEMVVMKMLEKFEGRVEVVKELGIMNEELRTALDNSKMVQNHFILNSKFFIPAARLWPHTFSTDGFFAAVFTKTAPTRDRIHGDVLENKAQPLTGNRERDLRSLLVKLFGTDMIHDGELLLHHADTVYVTTKEAASMQLPFPTHSIGLPFLKGIRDSAQIRLTHELSTLRGTEAASNVIALNDEQLRLLLDGNDIDIDPDIRGDHILIWNGISICTSKVKDEVVRNGLPRDIVQQVTN